MDACLAHCAHFVVGYLDTTDATQLRGTCAAAREAVAEFPWHDMKARIVSPARWRAAFPIATGANVSENHTLSDADFVHLRGLRELDMSSCWRAAITDVAFAHLAGIRVLNMAECSQPSITGAAFAHLKGIRSLDMSWCNQIDDAAFAHLAGIRTLVVSECHTLTNAAFAPLVGIHTLDMSGCDQWTLGDAAFVYLKGICALDMRRCNQDSITDAAFMHLAGIRTLDMRGCTQHSITDAAFAPLAGIHSLDVRGCYQPTITAAAFAPLGIRLLLRDGEDESRRMRERVVRKARVCDIMRNKGVCIYMLPTAHGDSRTPEAELKGAAVRSFLLEACTAEVTLSTRDAGSWKIAHAECWDVYGAEAWESYGAALTKCLAAMHERADPVRERIQSVVLFEQSETVPYASVDAALLAYLGLTEADVAFLRDDAMEEDDEGGEDEEDAEEF